MSTSQEEPALIQYACERCKTRYVLPPSSRQLSVGGKIRAFGSGLGRTLRYREGLGAGYDAARRTLLSKMDDKAYQSFVQSFRFCHECRQFVCSECWSTSRRSCLTCVAKSMTEAASPRPPFAPPGPEIPRPVVAPGPGQSRRLRRNVALGALALGLILVTLEVGAILANANSAGPAPQTVNTPGHSAIAVASPTATPRPSLTPSPSPSPTASPTPTDTPTPTPTPTSAPTPTPTPTPRPTLPTPTIACASVGSAWTCTWTNQGAIPGGTPNWYERVPGTGYQSVGVHFGDLPADGGPYSAYLVVTKSGFPPARSATKTGP